MSSSLTVEETGTNIQTRRVQHEPEVGQGSYGAAVISLYVLGMTSGFAFLVNGMGLKTAVSVFFAFLLSCVGGILLLWWRDEKLWSATPGGQTQHESFGVVSDGEGHEALGATPP